MMEPLKAELDRMIKLEVIHKLHINETTDWVHNLVPCKETKWQIESVFRSQDYQQRSMFQHSQCQNFQ